MPNLIIEATKHLHIVITLFNKSMQDTKPPIAINVAKKTKIRLKVENPIDFDANPNPMIDMFFLET